MKKKRRVLSASFRVITAFVLVGVLFVVLKYAPVWGAGLKFAETSYDAGTITGGYKFQIIHKFPFVNNGREVLRIDKVKASCSCAVTKLNKTEYQPGETGVIEATLYLKTLGTARSNILVISNAESSPEELFITATFAPTIVAQPESRRINLRDVPLNHLHHAEMKIYVFHKNLMDFQVKKIDVSGNELKVEFKDSATSRYKNPIGYYVSTYNFDILVQADIPGQLVNNVKVEFSAPEVPPVEVPILSYINPDITITPERSLWALSADDIDNGFSPRTVKLKDRNDHPLIWEGIENPYRDWLDAQVEKAESGTELTVKLIPKKIPSSGAIEGHLILKVKGEDGNTKELKLPLQVKII